MNTAVASAIHLTKEVVALANRIMALGPGNYMIVLDKKSRSLMTWKVVNLDKVKEERP